VTSGPFETVRQDSPSTLILAGNDAKNLASVLADDPLRAVQSLPGVSSNDDYDARFSLRGADYSRIGVYLDNILLHMPFHTVEGTSTTGSATAFNGDMVEELELHPGAYPVRFGDRTGGVLDVHTRDGSRTQTSIRGTVSPSNAGLMAEGPLGKSHRGSWLVGARKGFLQYLLNRMNADPSIAFDMADAQGRIAYDLTPHNSLSLYVLESSSTLDRSRYKSTLGINSLMEAGYHFTFGNLAWRSTPASTLLVVNHAAWMREKFDNTNPANLPLAGDHYGEWVWDSSATWMWNANAPLDVGFSVRRLHESGYSNQRLSAAPFVRLLDHYDGTAAHEGGYAQQSWTLAGGHLHFSAGARWDHHSLMGRSVVSPQASAAATLGASTHLQLGWGQYVQFPEISDLTSPLSAAHLLPQRSTQALAAIEQRLGERTRVRLEYYEREDRDLLYRPFYDPRMLLNWQGLHPPGQPAAAQLQPCLRARFRVSGGAPQRQPAHRVGFLRLWGLAPAGRLGGNRLSLRLRSAPHHQPVRRLPHPPHVNLSAKWTYGSNFPYPGLLAHAERRVLPGRLAQPVALRSLPAPGLAHQQILDQG
jgi:hypothetical protein